MKNIAFYLPQFHAIPENDRWWGSGFTEWTNVRRAEPQFDGHEQPRSVGQLGEYDLLDEDVLHQQSELARTYGIDGFCTYFYWFDGARLLDQPLEKWRRDATLLPYCLSWANESWTRRWDGKDREVLVQQGYPRGFAEDVFDAMLPHLEAPHYITNYGLPLLVVHRADIIPDAREMTRAWRRRAHRAGLPGLYLAAAETKPGLRPNSIGFDAIVEFPPVGSNTFGRALRRPLSGVSDAFRGRLLSYDRLANYHMHRREPEFIRHHAVAPGWDNTPRRQAKGTIYVGSTPAKYAHWLAAARAAEYSSRGDDGIVFINAWNEWGEGAYLEPDSVHGLNYLRATRIASSTSETFARTLTRGRWSRSQVRSIFALIAGSLLAIWRRARSRLQ